MPDLLDDDDELLPERPPLRPAQPLPRIVRTAPLTEAEAEEQDRLERKVVRPGKIEDDEEEPPPEKQARPAKKDGGRAKGSGLAEKPGARTAEKPGKKSIEKEKKGVLVEETPELDTYESRKKIRLVVGLSVVAFIALAIVGFAGMFGRNGPSTEPALPPNAAPPPGLVNRGPVEDQSEPLAAQYLAQAEANERAGRLDLAEDRLRRILANYPHTTAAPKAREALDRRAKGLPLFGPAVVAEKVDQPPIEPPPVVKAEAVRPPMPGGGEVSIRPPDHPAEPRRLTGLPREVAQIEPRPLPPGFRMRAEEGVHPSGWPNEITSDRDGSTLVLVPGGTFTMGRDAGPAADSPAHRVALSPFYIDQHEVTGRQFRRFLERTGHKAPKFVGDDDDRPAVNVSHRDAEAYAEWVGKRLPTEAQWELAARTTDGRIYPWGPNPPAWEKPRDPKQIDLVMSYPSDLSPYSVFDLAGNAWEWMADVFDAKYYRQLRDQVAVNPAGPSVPRGRAQYAVRGVSATWQVSERAGLPPDTHYPYLGFRCALNVEGGSPTGPGLPAGHPVAAPGGSLPANAPGGGAIRPF